MTCILQLDGVEYRKGRGRPKGSRDTKPRIRAGLCSTARKVNSDTGKEPAFSSASAQSDASDAGNLDQSSVGIFEFPTGFITSEFVDWSRNSSLISGPVKMEAAQDAAFSLAESFSIIGNDSADPFHGDWAYW